VNIQSCNAFHCRRELTVFDFGGVYATDIVVDYFNGDNNSDVDIDSDLYDSSHLGFPTVLPEDILEVYNNAADRVSGFEMLTLGIVNFMSEAFLLQGGGQQDYTVGSCGILPNEIVDGTASTDNALCVPGDNGTCTAEYDFCVLLTNVKTINASSDDRRDYTSTMFTDPQSVLVDVDGTWQYEFVEVSFVLVSDQFQSNYTNAEFNNMSLYALRYALGEDEDCDSDCVSIADANVEDLGFIEDDWLSILHDPAGSSFILGYEQNLRVCINTDGDEFCDEFDACPLSPNNDGDGDGVCSCSSLMPEGMACDCDDSDPSRAATCDSEIAGAISGGEGVKWCTYVNDPDQVQYQVPDDGVTDNDDDGYCDESVWQYALIGSAVAVAGAVAAGLFYRARTLVQGRLQVYQKEVFNDAMNRNRSPPVRLADASNAVPMVGPAVSPAASLAI